MCARSFSQEPVRLGEVLAVRPLGLVEVRHGVEPQPVDPEREPEVDDLEQRLVHGRVLEVEIGLMRIEAVPVVRARERIPVQFEGSKSLKMMRASR